MENIYKIELSGNLAFSWASSQNLHVFQKAMSGSSVLQKDVIYEIQGCCSMNSNVFLQRLARASYDIFRTSQKCLDTSNLLRLSHQYRTSLAMCSQEIFEFLESCQSISREQTMALAAEGELVKAYELIWHLVEVVLLQEFSSGQLTYGLTGWYFIQSQEAANTARSILEGSKNSKNVVSSASLIDDKTEERFWPTILTLITQARPLETASLLAAHPKANTGLCRHLRHLLNCMPTNESTRVSSESPWLKDGTKKEEAWEFWCNDVINNLQSSTSTSETDEHLNLIVTLLAGYNEAWRDSRILDACDNVWYFHFSGWLFYTHRFAKTESLSSLLNEWRLLFGSCFQDSSAGESPLDKIIDELINSIFEADLMSLLYIMSEKFNNWWMVAHLASFFKCLFPELFTQEVPAALDAYVKREENVYVNTHESTQISVYLPDFFLLSYAESLASEPSLLSVALCYLDHCTSVCHISRQLQDTLLRRSKPSSTSMTNFLIKEARKRDLHEAADELARVKAHGQQAYIKNANVNPAATVCSALGWAAQARDKNQITRLATQVLWADIPRISSPLLFQHHCGDGVLKEVASLVSSLFAATSTTTTWLSVCPELAFLVRYAELHQLVEDRQLRPAVELLLDLLSADHGQQSSSKNEHHHFHLPLHFRLHLLAKIRPYLEAENEMLLARDQLETLTSVTTELQTTIELVGGAESADKLSVWFLGLHALLAQTRANAILRSTPSSTAGDLLCPFSDVASEYAAIIS